MSTRGIKDDVRVALRDRKIDAKEIDQLVVKARDEGGIDIEERKLLNELLAGNRFDVARDRLREHLGFIDAKSYVNVEVAGSGVRSIEGRVAHLSTKVPGLDADVSLFDNAVALRGKAKADGKLTLVFASRPVTVDVKKGETAAAVLGRVRTALPEQVRAHLFSDGLYPGNRNVLEGMTPNAASEQAHLVVWRPLPMDLPPGTRRLKVLVTGYGPFGGYSVNPSGELAKAVEGLPLRGAELKVEVLPVEYGKVEAFIERLRSDPPDVVLSMGVGPREIETVAYNWNAGHADAAGGVGPGRGPINPSTTEEQMAINLPLSAINERLKDTYGNAATLTVTRTPDPPGEGAYLCNYLNWRLAETFRGTKTSAGFVHINEGTTPEEIQTVLEAVVAEKVRTESPIA